MERPKRTPYVSSSRANAKNAIEALKAAREGTAKRAQDYQVRKEAAVYDVLDEQEYVKLVAKRREEGGDFIVDDDGQGYADLGEEDDHWRSKGDDSEPEDQEEEEEESVGKKRKGKDKDGKSRKKGAGDAAGSGNIAKMFSKAQAKAALTGGVTAAPKPAAIREEDSDALLADILGGIGGDAPAAPAVAVMPMSLARATPPSSSAAVGVPRMGGVARHVGSLPGRAGVGARPGVGGMTSSLRPAARFAAPPAAAAAPPASMQLRPSKLGFKINDDLETHDHNDVMQSHDADHDMQMQVDDHGAAQHDGDAMLDDADHDAHAHAADHDHDLDTMQDHAAADVKTPAKATQGIGAIVKERVKGTATGWTNFLNEANAEEAVGEEDVNAPIVPSPLPASDANGTPSGSSHLSSVCALPDGMTPFYFLDAYENYDMRPGEVFMFGKVPVEPSQQTQGRTTWASACVLVKGCTRSIIVAPKSHVFADTDGSIAQYEAELAAFNKEATMKQSEACRHDLDARRHLDKAEAAEKLEAIKAEAAEKAEEGAEKQEADQKESAKTETSAAEARAKHEESLEAAAAARAASDAARQAAAAKKLELLKLLQSMCGDLKAELRELLTRHGVKSFRMVPVKRSYAFENTDVPRGEQWCIKIRYPASEATLPYGLTGTHFAALFGATTPCLESLLVKRGVKGPCWLLLNQATRVEFRDHLSWCKVEMTVPSPKCVIANLDAYPSMNGRTAPPLTVASLNLKTIINPHNHQHEVVAAALVYLQDCIDIEAPMDQKAWNKPSLLRNCTIIRKLDGTAWPPGFEQTAQAENQSARGKMNGGQSLILQSSERSLYTCLLAKMQSVDADVLVGHNISAFDLHVLLTRMQHHKVPLWSRIGRLKRTAFPKLTGGGHAYGGGASAGVMSAIAGRVICDTYLSARELVREIDYTLRTLARSLLQQDKGEISSSEIPACFTSVQGLVDLIRHAEGDAWLSMGLMHHLAVLPLTRALTALSGFYWSKTLQGARAQRIEMLLLHEFHARKYIMPDKAPYKDREASGKASGKGSGKGSGRGGADAQEDMMDVEEHGDDEVPKNGKAKTASGKGPQYAGGLVLEPKKGLYDKIVIMLDFNSLYPSIIQEFNICFSTVQRPDDGSLPPLPGAPPDGRLAPLPMILQNLVQQRRKAKQAMAGARDAVMRQQFNIRQQALKLTANSMYGCLGFSSSRFYAKPLAELVTSQGRSILQSTVDLVQGTIGAEVIYGDTDSIMINTGLTDIAAARELGFKIKKEVNKRYKLLEIELDGIFKCMLLLKKKKYAAIKLEPGPNNQLMEIQEQKGLDIVRRDWCGLSKEAGHRVLRSVLSCGQDNAGQDKSSEQVIEEIHEILRRVRDDVKAGQVPLDQFVITKQLTKRPEEYADARAQPHVQVALRRRAAGKRDGVMPGEAVPYVICVDTSTGASQPPAAAAVDPSQPSQTQPPVVATPGDPATPAAHGNQPDSNGHRTPAAANGGVGTPKTAGAVATPGTQQHTQPPAAAAAASSGAMGLAERAYHPEELVESGGRLVVDADYYLGQQVHPVVSRLVAVLQGTDAARLAECLGLDPSRYKGSAGNANSSYQAGADGDSISGGLLDDDDAYQACQPLVLTCPGPNPSTFTFRGALDVVLDKATAEQLLTPPDAVGDVSKTLGGAHLVNQVVMQSRQVVSSFYDGWLDADDELASDRMNNTGSSSSGGGGVTDQQHGLRDVVLRPCGELEKMPHPDAAKHGGVLLSRRMDEKALYMQLSHYVRLLDPDLAVKRGLARIKAQNPRTTITEAELRNRLAPIWPALRAAADAVNQLRSQSAYHWVDVTRLFGALAPRPKAQPPQQQTAAPMETLAA